MIQKAYTTTTSASLLTDVSPTVVGTLAVQIVGAGFTGSVAFRGRVMGSGLTPVTIMYKNRADDTTANAALTGNALVEINAAGLEVFADVTVSGGTVTLYMQPVLG